jgi:hypothetical protein
LVPVSSVVIILQLPHPLPSLCALVPSDTLIRRYPIQVYDHHPWPRILLYPCLLHVIYSFRLHKLWNPNSTPPTRPFIVIFMKNNAFIFTNVIHWLIHEAEPFLRSH